MRGFTNSILTEILNILKYRSMILPLPISRQHIMDPDSRSTTTQLNVTLLTLVTHHTPHIILVPYRTLEPHIVESTI